MIRIPTHRTPTHPGEMLLEEFLRPMRLTQKELAVAIRVPYQRVNEIINGRRGITPSTALRLAKFFGISPDFILYRSRNSAGKVSVPRLRTCMVVSIMKSFSVNLIILIF